MNGNRNKLHRRLGVFAATALVAVSWVATRSAQAIPVPYSDVAPSVSSPSASELKTLLTFPEGIPLGGLANFQPSSFLGEQLLSFTQLPPSAITQVGGLKGFPVLDPTVSLTTPALLQQIFSTLK